MSPTLTILKEMRSRPVAIYIGDTSLRKLADFLRGCQHAAERLTGRTDEFLCEFGDWVRERFGSPSEGWEKLIVKHSADDCDAVSHFWRLLDEFVSERGEVFNSQVITTTNGAAAVAVPAQHAKT